MSELPNIALFVVDSARGDWVPASPTGEDTFGDLMALAKAENGQYFRTAHAHSITSASSMGSLATGLYPFKHGLVPATGALTDDISTVAEKMADAGYHTVGVSANTHFSPHTNLDRGFDIFRFLSSNPKQLLDEIGVRAALKFGLKVRSESAGLDLTPEKHTVTPLMNTLVEESVEQAPHDQPFFLLAQYIEPHSPYYPPQKLLDTSEKRRQAELSYRVHDEMYERVADGCRVSDEEWAALKEMYALEIRYTAEKIYEAIQTIKDESSREIIVIVTADHGDLFGEQGLLFHSQPLHNKLTHVPLLTQNLDVKDPSSPTTHVDIIKTLVDIAGGETDDLDGINLREETRDRFVTQRPYPEDYELIREHNPEYENSYHHEQPVTAFHIDRYKMNVSEDRTRFFNIDEDPAEEEPLDPEEVPVRIELVEWSEEWFEEHGRSVHGAESAEMDEATREQLEGLGYL